MVALAALVLHSSQNASDYVLQYTAAFIACFDKEGDVVPSTRLADILDRVDFEGHFGCRWQIDCVRWTL